MPVESATYAAAAQALSSAPPLAMASASAADSAENDPSPIERADPIGRRGLVTLGIGSRETRPSRLHCS